MTAAETTPVKRVTTADVAKASGVSRATVSYVLNDVPGRAISQATRDLVLETAHRLGHIPNGPARSLRTGRSNVVLALVRDYTIGYVADRLIEELDRALAARGFVLVVHRFEEDQHSISELWGMISPDLVVSMGGLTPPTLPEHSPVRLLGVHGIFPHERAGAIQIEYLHSRGHRHIGYAAVDNPRVALVAQERYAGAVQATAGLSLPPLRRHSLVPGDVDGANRALDDWLGGDSAVTAICAHNDEMALMLMSAMQSRGLRPGHDIAVIGVDNIPIARMNVTTVEINVDAYTELIVDRVMRVVDGEALESDPVSVESLDLLRLIVRDSA
ncbi:LacI family DNA-binding transcriptional regulator [Microbacterium invictum]|uniref:DNA-binding LacI/PurR family transcriptional regulator n=1 Tax=Microbacterium invictum TaxID=515415 RepID=A0AA40SQ37_9MICO|nr:MULTISPECIES: LacI family DNA-binding transcriptional regulator [Microbacterium]MBB4140259.1 DNA-binding LacI/PurR family transcriptional regulator [Microbacterium invictum]